MIGFGDVEWSYDRSDWVDPVEWRPPEGWLTDHLDYSPSVIEPDRFRNKHTQEPISREDFLVICQREIARGAELDAHERDEAFAIEREQKKLTEQLETHPTGALRESKEGKGRPDLVLAGFPRALSALSRHVDCELGRQRNWEKGLPESSLVSSAFRHLMGYTSGVSEDSPEYNLTAFVWNAIVLLEEYLRVQDQQMCSKVLDIEKEACPVAYGHTPACGEEGCCSSSS